MKWYNLKYLLQVILYSHSMSSWVYISAISLSLACSQPFCCYLYISLLPSFLSSQTKLTCVRQALLKSNCQSIRIQIINISLHHKSHLLSCSAFVCIPPSNTPLLVLTIFHHSPPCLFLANSPFLSLSSLPLLPLFSTPLPPPLFLLSFSPPACLPSSFHLSSLKLTVPEGRGHLRTKWRISRQLCAHSLRWPSIIHSLLPPPFPSLHLHSALFISPCRLCLYLSVASSHRDCVSASLALSISVIPSFNRLNPLFPLSPSFNVPPGCLYTLAHTSDHHSTIFSPSHPYCISPAAPYLHFTNLLLLFPSVSSCLPLSHAFPQRLMTLRHKASGPV